MVLTFTVFSSILDPQMAQNVAQEIVRVLRPQGFLLWYDFRFNNPRNPHVRGMTSPAYKPTVSYPETKLVLSDIVAPFGSTSGSGYTCVLPVLTQLPF